MRHVAPHYSTMRRDCDGEPPPPNKFRRRPGRPLTVRLDRVRATPREKKKRKMADSEIYCYCTVVDYKIVKIERSKNGESRKVHNPENFHIQTISSLETQSTA